MQRHTPHQHQVEGFEAIKSAIDAGVPKMQLIYPTGGGKTDTQMDVINYLCEQADLNDEPGICAVVLAPRIQLCVQHLKEHVHNPIYTTAIHPMAVHSGRGDVPKEFMFDRAAALGIDDADSGSVFCDTSSSMIAAEYNRAMEQGKHFVIFGTYHSAERIAASGVPIDIIVCDESQYLVSPEFAKLHTVLTADHWLFCTATQKNTKSSNGIGMGNKTLFGNVVYQVPFKTLVERGIITPVKLHVMYAEGIRTDGVLIANKKADSHDHESNYDAVKEIVKVQAANTPFDEKILVVCKDVAEVKYLAKEFNKDSEFDNYTVFHISASGGNIVNGKKVSRGDFLAALNACTGKALIFHYDILSEGIDVGGISGVILLRAMGVAKTLQTIGRSVRVLPSDRPLPIEQRVKQCAWVSVPVVLSADTNSEDYQSIKQSLLDILTALEMGGVPIETVTTHAPRGEPDDDVEHDPLDFPEDIRTTFSDLFDLEQIRHEAHEIVVDQERKEFKVMVKSLNTIDEFFAVLDEELLA